LMGASSPVVPATETLPPPAHLSPGMASLLRRGNGLEEPEAPGDTPQQARDPAAVSLPLGASPVVRGSLFLADALLVGLAVWMRAKAPGSLGGAGIALCLFALLLGAWLSCLALWLNRPGAGETS